MTAASPTVLTGHGFSVQPPAGWEARIYRRAQPLVPDTPAHRATGAGASGWFGEQPLPIVHLANFALPAVRGDFGSGAVERMGREDVFLALLQVGSDCLGSALYRRLGRPQVEQAQFAANGLQRILPGQAGAQYFFTEGGRPFCLYVVLGSTSELSKMTREVNQVLNAVQVMP